MTINIAEIVLLAIAVAQWLKSKANLEGTKAEVVAAITGFILGAGYQATLTTEFTTPNAIFAIVVTGLGVALAQSGLYKFVGMVADRIATPKVQ